MDDTWIVSCEYFIKEIQAMLTSFDRSVNPCRRTSVSWKHSICNQCVESDWFSIFIQYLVFILNTPAVTLQIATRGSLVRFRMYVVQRGWPNSGTWGQGACGISVFGDMTLICTRCWATGSVCWSCIKWGLDGLQRALATSSIVLCLSFFFENIIYILKT